MKHYFNEQVVTSYISTKSINNFVYVYDIQVWTDIQYLITTTTNETELIN